MPERNAPKRPAHRKFRAASRRRAKTIGRAKPSEAWAPAKFARFTAILVLLTAAIALPAGATGSDTLLWRPPVSGGRADAGWSGFRFWAAGEGFSVGRRSAGYGVQGGAALPLAGRIGLTAGYRLTGFALGDRLGAELDDVAARSLAPILGIDVEF